ncbi:O(6)-methylguanine-induced apoptosis 2 isoform X3 [Hydra vulgaris]|uniref:O(6)-methylguanine-induced apoptosis 2 isoform X3 n=1 Tax=Hydra vulgaris TaxID=6087 RepID=A0ABM4D7E5_HYDVU
MSGAVASIPSKYQTIVKNSNEKLAFNSKSKRFSNNQSDGPSPLSYDLKNTLANQNNCSFSKRGFGGFASKVKRFTVPRNNLLSVGPGHYNLGQKVSFSYSYSPCTRNFHPPTMVQRSCKLITPAPNHYNVCKEISHRLAKKNPTKIAFMSQEKRDLNNGSTNKDIPAPGSYNISEELANAKSRSVKIPFNSTVQRCLPVAKSENPGPAAYNLCNRCDKSYSGSAIYHPCNVEPFPSTFQHKRCYCVFHHAAQLPPKPITPGPGHYELVKYEEPKLPISSSMFVSSTNRCAKNAFNSPGPAAYDPRHTLTQSFFYNFEKKWI